MANFELRRSDYGAALRDTTIPAPGFVLRATGIDPTITPGTPTTSNETEAKLVTSGDGKVKIT